MTTRPLGPDSLLLPADAAAELGGRASSARAWLAPLVREVPGLGARVRWGDVLAAAGWGPTDRTAPPSVADLPRVPCGGRARGPIKRASVTVGGG